MLAGNGWVGTISALEADATHGKSGEAGSMHKKESGWKWPNLEAIFFPPQRKLSHRIWIVLLIVSIAFGVRMLIGNEELGLPFLTFFPAAALSAIFAGFWAGMLATLMGSLLATYFFIPPHGVFSFALRPDIVFGNLVYILDAIFVCGAIEWLYRFYRRVKIQNSELTALIRTIPDLIWLRSPEGVYLECNPAFERFYGRARKEVVGRHADEVLPEGTAEMESGQFNTTIAGDAPTVKEYWVSRATDESYVLLETISTAMRTSDGTLAGVLSIARDVTEHRLLQEEVRRRTFELEKERAFLTAVLEHTVDGILAVKTRGKIMLANHCARQMLDPECDPVGRNLRDYWPDWPVIEAKAAEGFEVRVNLQSGDTVLALAVTPTGKNGTTQYVVVARDIGEETRFADERRELDKQMFQMEKMVTLGELAMGVAHEIGNPLGGMKAVVQSLQYEKELPAEMAEELCLLESEIDRLSDFLHSFHGFAATQPLNSTSCQLLAIVHDLLFWIRKEALSQSVTVKVQINEHITMMADASQLKQVLLNLFVNAIHAMPGGGTMTIAAAEETGMIRISVADTGSGIPAEVLPQIYDPFFTTKIDGSGLGLSIVKKIVAEHGAHIKVESLPGCGSCFILDWPAADAEPQQ